MIELFKKEETSDLVKRVVLGFVLALLLTTTLILAFEIQPAKASGTIYIRADGSIDPRARTSTFQV
jgi:hypothetical protein